MERTLTDTLAGGAPAPLRMREPKNLVSRRAIGYWLVRALMGWVVFAAAQVGYLVIFGDSLVWHVAGLAVTVVLAAAHLAVMPQWRYRVHRWEVTPHAVYTQAGWFSQQRRIAPISRIQTVDTERGPVEQLFRLSNLTVTTASAAGPLRIHGLDKDDAQRVVDDLAQAIESTRGDAT